MSIDDLIDVARAADGDELVAVDVFTGPGLTGGRQAVGLRLTVNGADHTLTTRQVEEIRERVVARLVEAYGAERR